MKEKTKKKKRNKIKKQKRNDKWYLHSEKYCFFQQIQEFEKQLEK
jgi:hypothetical protein